MISADVDEVMSGMIRAHGMRSIPNKGHAPRTPKSLGQAVRTAYCEVWQAISKSLLTYFAEAAVSTNHYLGFSRCTICEEQLYVVIMLLQLGETLVEVNSPS
ncbi:MAG: hypothetical protein FRX49_01257 [Trebouxia sp. A1-2]|nr:MAG: hypothetical protein FRX49_01257 [Trebouxia sp. A1-2]